MAELHWLGLMNKQREKRIDPQPGDRLKHHDGGTIYVLARRPRMVLIKRRSQNREWVNKYVRLSTLQGMVNEQMAHQKNKCRHGSDWPCKRCADELRNAMAGLGAAFTKVQESARLAAIEMGKMCAAIQRAQR